MNEMWNKLHAFIFITLLINTTNIIVFVVVIDTPIINISTFT